MTIDNETMKENQINPWADSADLPDDYMPCHSYAEFKNIINRWAKGLFKLNLVVVGAPGVGKSETATIALKEADEAFLYCKGKCTHYALYKQLSEHIDELVLLDDLDELVKDPNVTGLLKMALETKEPHVIKWQTAKTLSDDSNLPSEFYTSSRCCLLVNEVKVVSKDFKACLDRAQVIWFAPTLEEVRKYVATWFNMKEHKDVYDYVSDRLTFAASPSCRYYYKAAKLKEGGFDWRSMIERQMKPQDAKSQLVLALEGNKDLPTVKQKIEEWTKLTGLGKVSYHAYKTALGIKQGKLSKTGPSISAALKRKHAAKKEGKQYKGVAYEGKTKKKSK